MRTNTFLAVVTFAHISTVHGFDAYDHSHEDVASGLQPRIFFGESADVSTFPFLVYMSSDVNCAGSIVGDRWILTAGHCVGGSPCAVIRLWPGMWQSSNPIHPSRCHIHPQYVHHNGIHPYDVALLYVEQSLLGNGRAMAIPLPPPGKIFPIGTKAIITGWGLTETGGTPNRLMAAQVVVDHWHSCSMAYKESRCGPNPQCQEQVNIPRRIICTQGLGNWPPGTCFGDSGGPVIIDGILAGLVSFGVVNSQGMCGVGTPSMQVNVADYLPWIYSIVDPMVDTSGMPVQPEI